MGNLPLELSSLTLCAFVYLFFDTYPIVKSATAIFRSWSFWLFWFALCFLNYLAYNTLRIAAAARIEGIVGTGFTTILTLVLLATLGTVSIVQSFSVKIANYKFLDVGLLIDGFRNQVREDVLSRRATQNRLEAMAVATKLHSKLPVDSLRNEYALVMSFGCRTLAEIGEELSALKTEADRSNLSFTLEIARRIAQVDILRARELLRTVPGS